MVITAGFTLAGVAFKVLEPCAGKLARTVLRGRKLPVLQPKKTYCMTSTKWKDRLLSSSIPLEYEVGRILKQENYYVDFDFTYQRLDGKEEKEFSIDLSAVGFTPFNDSNTIDIALELLIECKYRNPDVKWAFLPNLLHDDEIEKNGRPIVHFIDEFSEVRLSNTWNKSYKIKEISNKGVEINTSNGEVHDKGIHHGINQLIFSLPVVLSRMITSNLEDALEDVHPNAFCPILVTTAELRIFNKDFSIESVKNAEDLDNLSKEVPYLIFQTDLYPSFEKHCKNTFKNVPEESIKRFDYYNDLQSIMISSIDGVKNEDPDVRFYKTEHLMSSLKNGKGHSYFNEIVICNLKHLPQLISEISTSVEEIGKNIERLTKGSS